MARVVFTLIHNCLIHPLCGVAWAVSDTLDLPALDRAAERLHGWHPRWA